MWKFVVANHYDFAVLKIQMWWRRRNFQRIIRRTIMSGGRFSKQPISNEVVDNVRLEMKIAQQQLAAIAHTKS